MVMQLKAKRHDWYQTSEHVVVAVMLKNCDPAKVQVSFSKDKLVCRVDRIPDPEYVPFWITRLPALPVGDSVSVS